MNNLYQLISYASIGFIAYLADIFCFYLGTELLQVAIIPANFLARSIGAAVAYTLNYAYTFQSTTTITLSLLKYLMLWLVNSIVSSTLIYSLYEHHFANALLLKIVVESAILVINFCICKLWVYRS